MRIHHYTKANTLPLILRSGKIRFTRADQLDDGSEMPFQTAHIDAQHYFVSSWTTAANEHSGQWYRYGDQHRGVRITLPSAPFEFHRISMEISRKCTAPSLSNTIVGFRLIDINMPFTTVEMLGKGYLLTPYSDDMSKNFGGAVEYVVNPDASVAELISDKNQVTTIFDAGRLGRIKSADWSDQAEYRFVLMAREAPEIDRSHSHETYDNALLDLYESKLITGNNQGATRVKFIDLPLAEKIADSIIITLGCHISAEDKMAIFESVRLYSPNTKIIESNMNVRKDF